MALFSVCAWTCGAAAGEWALRRRQPAAARLLAAPRARTTRSAPVHGQHDGTFQCVCMDLRRRRRCRRHRRSMGLAAAAARGGAVAGMHASQSYSSLYSSSAQACLVYGCSSFGCDRQQHSRAALGVPDCVFE
ncbi:hypothetical protein JKP88DRAFT_240646 [Tribonema minus]|uniref:Uncharacterized protein n=1 Tax=Tribonema minus TaxID=303371 RepID=A0A835ZL42_9STRA|nr:hypothetical protein JKP88DRAFT_240646 [Tribonema minus]